MPLEISGLSHRYGGTRALAETNLSLEKGQHCLLLEPSGSGKTTLINLICGLLRPQHGRIAICGEDIGTAGAAKADDIRRRHIGIVFQTLRLISALDLAANLSLAQRLQRGVRGRTDIDVLLDQLGIRHRVHAKPHQLSQGEAQRAAIARALIARPALLVADEPTSALDDANMQRVARLLLESAERTGATLLIATHDERLRQLIPNVVNLSPAREAAA